MHHFEKTSFTNRKEMLDICSSINSYQMFNVLLYIFVEIRGLLLKFS